MTGRAGRTVYVKTFMENGKLSLFASALPFKLMMQRAIKIIAQLLFFMNAIIMFLYLTKGSTSSLFLSYTSWCLKGVLSFTIFYWTEGISVIRSAKINFRPDLNIYFISIKLFSDYHLSTFRTLKPGSLLRLIKILSRSFLLSYQLNETISNIRSCSLKPYFPSPKCFTGSDMTHLSIFLTDLT